MSKWLRAMGAGSRAGPGTSSNSSSVASVPHVPRGGCKGAHGGGPRRLRLARQEKKPREGEEIAPLFAERLQIVGPGVELLRGERLLATHELDQKPHDAVAVGVLAQPRVGNRIAPHPGWRMRCISPMARSTSGRYSSTCMLTTTSAEASGMSSARASACA